MLLARSVAVLACLSSCMAFTHAREPGDSEAQDQAKLDAQVESMMREADLMSLKSREDMDKETPVVRREGRKRHDDSSLKGFVSDEATAAEKSMISAVTQEASGSESAVAAASNMVKAAVSRADSILAKALQDIRKISTDATKAMATMKSSSDSTVHATSQTVLKAQAATKSNSEKVQTRLKTVSTHEQMIRAASESNAVTEAALASSKYVERGVNLMAEELSAAVEHAKETSSKASSTIQKFIKQASADGEAIADQLVATGSKASAGMNAKEKASSISKLTSGAAADIKTKTQRFVETSNAILSNAIKTGDETVAELTRLLESQRAKGDMVAKMLSDGAHQATDALAAGRAEWIRADIEALNSLEEGSRALGDGGGRMTAGDEDKDEKSSASNHSL